jgi:transcription elongation GreA/GreB family factor
VAGIPPKERLRDELAGLLAADLETRERALRAAREGATHEEAKPENDKDTRALEQSYLARGQALRIEELRTGLVEVESMTLRAFGPEAPAAMGALVTVLQDDVTSLMFLAPHGGGTRIAAGTVQVVTPRSPLGLALLGKRAGDDGVVTVAGKVRELSIVSVQ